MSKLGRSISECGIIVDACATFALVFLSSALRKHGIESRLTH